jgi:hypothetical protein
LTADHVKTQKIEKRRERFFLPPPKFALVANFSGPRDNFGKTFVLSPLREAEFLHSLDPELT